MGEKPLNTKNETKEKKFPVQLPSRPSFYEMEANCFPVPENKPDLPLVREDS